jgi:hypothetical protein
VEVGYQTWRNTETKKAGKRNRDGWEMGAAMGAEGGWGWTDHKRAKTPTTALRARAGMLNEAADAPLMAPATAAGLLELDGADAALAAALVVGWAAETGAAEVGCAAAAVEGDAAGAAAAEDTAES